LLAPLGRRGSYVPTVLNVAQNLGWSTFELIIISIAAAKLSDSVFGFSARWVWAVAFGVISVALGLLGPIGFVRRYVKKFAAWAVLASIVYLTWWVLDKSHLHTFWAAKGGGGMTFGQGVDLVIGSIVSWTPLAADYTRFSRSHRSAFWGTSLGYFVPTLWCFGIGCLLVLARDIGAPEQIPAAVAAGGAGVLALLALTVDESDEAFADIYSTAVSLHNLLPRVAQRLVIALGRAALVDEPRRPHEPRPLRLDGVAAELRSRVRADARRPGARFGPCGRWPSSGASRSIALTAAGRGSAAPPTTAPARCGCSAAAAGSSRSAAGPTAASSCRGSSRSACRSRSGAARRRTGSRSATRRIAGRWPWTPSALRGGRRSWPGR